MQTFKQVEKTAPAIRARRQGFEATKSKPNIQRRRARALKLRMRGSAPITALCIVAFGLWLSLMIPLLALVSTHGDRLESLETAQKVDPSQDAVFTCKPIKGMAKMMACRVLEGL